MKLSKRSIALIIALCLTFSLAFSFLFTKAIEQSSSAVNIPQLMNYQGRLTENENPITGSVTVTFSIYDVPTGGAPIWTETQNVTVTDGVFNVILGGTNPLTPSVFSNGETYLGIQVEGDSEIQPRQRLVSVAYAFFAQDANTLCGMTPAELFESHIQDDFHMKFISKLEFDKGDYNNYEFSFTVPENAKMIIIQLNNSIMYYSYYYDIRTQVILIKDSLTFVELKDYSDGVGCYIYSYIRWEGDTIKMRSNYKDDGSTWVNFKARGTAYFYR